MSSDTVSQTAAQRHPFLPVVIQSKFFRGSCRIFWPWYWGGPPQKMAGMLALVFSIHSTSHLILQSQIKELPRRSLWMENVGTVIELLHLSSNDKALQSSKKVVWKASVEMGGGGSVLSWKNYKCKFSSSIFLSGVRPSHQRSASTPLALLN